MNKPNHDVEALEALASTLTDSINGYEEAASVANDGAISSFLHSKAQERRQITDVFRSRIASHGGNSDVSGSAAALHRRFWICEACSRTTPRQPLPRSSAGRIT